jgi:K+ transporter
MELVRSTPVTRSWKSTLTSLLFALAMLGAGIFLFYENRVITPVLFLLLAIVGAWAAVSNSYTGDCPA